MDEQLYTVDWWLLWTLECDDDDYDDDNDDDDANDDDDECSNLIVVLIWNAYNVFFHIFEIA